MNLSKKYIFFVFFPIVFAFTSRCSKRSSFTVQTIPYPDSLHIVLRQNWGWKPLSSNHPQHSIQYITIHHGGVYFSPDSDAVKYIRHLQDWSRQEKKWIDIPYHFMIDFDGNIYETRPINYPGDTNTGYDPKGHALICVIGNFEEQTPTDRQLKALIDLTSFLADYFHVPLDKIKGHKDYTETLCPGKNLYIYLQNGYLRQMVNQIIRTIKP